MKHLLPLLICLFISKSLFSHTGLTHSECAEDSLQDTILRESEVENHFRMPIPINVHIIRRSDGTGNYTKNDYLRTLGVLNAQFSQTKMIFADCELPSFIDSDLFVDFESATEEDSLISTYNEPDVINIYFAETVKDSTGALVCGYTPGPWSSGDFIIMSISCIANGTYLSHEMGHYFGLYDTHENTFGEELVARSNCTTNGDLLCDTPADPRLSNLNTTAACQYFGSGTDSTGAFYQPLTRNIMSSSPGNCRNTFTPEQIARMESYQLNFRDYLTCTTRFYPNLTFDPTRPSFYTLNGSEINVGIGIVNDGGRTTGKQSDLGIYLSTDSIITTSDYLFGTTSIPVINSRFSSFNGLLNNVCDFLWLPPGDYYIGVILDNRDNIDELNERDNIMVFPNGPHISLDCPVTAPPNLTLDVNSTNTFSSSNNQISVTVSILNNGLGVAGPMIEVGYYLSTDNILGPDDYLIGTSSERSIPRTVTQLQGTTLDACNLGFVLPDGDYYLMFKLDPEDKIAERNENDNIWSFANGPHISTNCASLNPPNLKIDGTGTNFFTVNNNQVNVSITVENAGQLGTDTSSTIAYYLSEDIAISTSDQFIGTSILPKLPPGASNLQQISVNICSLNPPVPDGNYHIGLLLDANEDIAESNETDNEEYFVNGPHAAIDCMPGTQYRITLTANPQIGGTVNGNGMQEEGQMHTVVAIPNSGYKFINWTSDSTVISTDSSYSFIVSEAVELVANFEMNTSIVSLENEVVAKIFPNPNQGDFFLELSHSIPDVKVEVFNTFGQKLFETTMSLGQRILKIDMAQYSEGIYWIRLNTQGDFYSLQMIKE